MLKDKTAAIPGGGICGMQGTGGQWGLDLAVRQSEPLVPGVRSLGQGRRPAPPKTSWYLFSAPGRRILPSCPPKMMFDLIQLPIFAFYEVLV